MLNMEHIESFVPQNLVPIVDRMDELRISPLQAKVYQKIFRLNTTPVVDNYTHTELIKQPLMALLAKTKVDRQAIRLLIHVHTSKVAAPFGSAPVRELNVACSFDRALVFSMTTNNCASWMYAVLLARQYLYQLDDPSAKAIIVSGDIAFTFILKTIPNATVEGAAAAAVLLGINGDCNRICGVAVKTVGKYSAGLWMNASLALAYEQQYVALMVETIMEAIAQSGVAKQQIKIILPHNSNFISWEKVMRLLDLPLTKVFLENLPKYGHCFGADAMINYTTVMAKNLLVKGDYYLMVTAGLGGLFTAMVVQY